MYFLSHKDVIKFCPAMVLVKAMYSNAFRFLFKSSIVDAKLNLETFQAFLKPHDIFVCYYYIVFLKVPLLNLGQYI